MDATTGKLTITFAEPISGVRQLTAIVGTDMHLDSVTRKVNGIRATNKSFAFLLDGRQHPGLRQCRAGAETRHRHRPGADDIAHGGGLAQSWGHTEVEFSGATQLCIPARVEGTPWMLGIAWTRPMPSPPDAQASLAATAAVWPKWLIGPAHGARCPSGHRQRRWAI